jgi:hypothetical protein
MLIDVTISGDRNVIEREAARIPKYEDLTTEIPCMWNVKTNVILIIIRVKGIISNHSESILIYPESWKSRNCRK